MISYVTNGMLTKRLYNNSAWVEPSVSTTTLSNVSNLTFGENGSPYSAEVEGHLEFDARERYAFDCVFRGSETVAFLYVGDHLVCHSDPYPFGENAYMRDGTTSLPLSNVTIRGKPMPFLLRVYGSSPFFASVRWTTVQIPNANASTMFETIPSSAFVDVPTNPDEILRRELQRSEASGWSLWSSHNILAAVLLPESAYFRHYICRISTNECLRETYIEDSKADIRVGRFAADKSYWTYYLAYAGVNVSLSFTGGQSPLRVLVDVVNCDNCSSSDYALVVDSQFAWGRAGVVSSRDGRTVRFEPYGQSPVSVTSMSSSDDELARALGGQLAYRLNQTVAFSSLETDKDVQSVTSAIDAARVEDEKAETNKYGDLGEVKEAVTASVMWNQVFVPTEL